MTKFQLLCSCIKCRRETTSGQLTRNHKDECPKPTTIVRFPGNMGRPAWNKGLRFKPDLRNPELIGKIGGYRPNAGRSKKFRARDSLGNDVVLQSTYELRCSEILNSLAIRWIRPKALKYDDRNYYADFYLIDYDIWLDPKNNYKAKQDSNKIQKVIDQNKIKLYVLTEDKLTEEYIKFLCS